MRKTKECHYWNRQQRRKYAKELISKNHLKNKKTIERYEKKMSESFKKGIGVLSLTTNPNSEKMWEEHANNHKGFMVEFDTKYIIKCCNGIIGKVMYYDTLPTLYPSPINKNMAILSVMIFGKLNKYAFEEEVRVCKQYSNCQKKIE